MIYACIVYRRLAAYDDYHLPHNVKPYGYDISTEDTSYPSMMEPTEPYDPTNPKQSFTARPRSLSALSALSASSLRLSYASRRESGSHVPQQQQQPQPSPPAVLERKSSYDHRRSTQFDEYVARRLSGGDANLRRSIEHALGAEFGGGGGGGDPQRDSLISNRTVPIQVVQPHDNELGARLASCDASISVVLSDGAAVSEEAPSRELSINSGVTTVAHSLVSVPEVHEEDELHMHPGVARARAQDRGAARQSLLGGRAPSRSPPAGAGAGAGAGLVGGRSSMGYVDGLEDIELGLSGRKRKAGGGGL